jgi:hypothetical protein
MFKKIQQLSKLYETTRVTGNKMCNEWGKKRRCRKTTESVAWNFVMACGPMSDKM